MTGYAAVLVAFLIVFVGGSLLAWALCAGAARGRDWADEQAARRAMGDPEVARRLAQEAGWRRG